MLLNLPSINKIYLKFKRWGEISAHFNHSLFQPYSYSGKEKKTLTFFPTNFSSFETILKCLMCSRALFSLNFVIFSSFNHLKMQNRRKICLPYGFFLRKKHGLQLSQKKRIHLMFCVFFLFFLSFYYIPDNTPSTHIQMRTNRHRRNFMLVQKF